MEVENEGSQLEESKSGSEAVQADSSGRGISSGGSSGNDSPKSPFRFFGPGFLVAAAFIGPGTVKTSLQAGGKYGFQLLWAILFAAIATIIFQGMAVRLGLVTGKGLAESLRDYFRDRRLQKVSLLLVIAAIVFGNTAYQAGNLSGAAQGLYHFVPVVPAQVWLLLCSGLAFFLIWTGTLKTLKIILTSLVGLMSVTFLVAAIQTRPNFPELMAGCFSFEVFDLAVVFALIGTTVVPYNLFLHSSTIAEQNSELLESDRAAKTHAPQESEATSNGSKADDPGDSEKQIHESADLSQALAAYNLDTWIAVWVGALVTAAIIVAASGMNATSFKEAAEALTDLIGGAGKAFFFIGLFAAGITSAITAPLAAGYVYAGCFGHVARADGLQVRKVAAGIIVVGYLVAAVFGKSPEKVIFLAQVANGMILPLIAIFLLIVMNDKKLLGDYRNRWQQNLLGGSVVVLVVILGLYKLATQFGILS